MCYLLVLAQGMCNGLLCAASESLGANQAGNGRLTTMVLTKWRVGRSTLSCFCICSSCQPVPHSTGTVCWVTVLAMPTARKCVTLLLNCSWRQVSCMSECSRQQAKDQLSMIRQVGRLRHDLLDASIVRSACSCMRVLWVHPARFLPAVTARSACCCSNHVSYTTSVVRNHCRSVVSVAGYQVRNESRRLIAQRFSCCALGDIRVCIISSSSSQTS